MRRGKVLGLENRQDFGKQIQVGNSFFYCIGRLLQLLFETRTYGKVGEGDQQERIEVIANDSEDEACNPQHAENSKQQSQASRAERLRAFGPGDESTGIQSGADAIAGGEELLPELRAAL